MFNNRATFNYLCQIAAPDDAQNWFGLLLSASDMHAKLRASLTLSWLSRSRVIPGGSVFATSGLFLISVACSS